MHDGKENKLVKNLEEFLIINKLSRPDFENTPQRASKTWTGILRQKKPSLATFPLQGKAGMVILKDHVTWGFCPHHLLPVKYIFRIGYIPEKIVLGASKLARIADYELRDLPLQEDIAMRVVNTIYRVVHPKGAGCVVQGEHLCMQMRGVKSKDSSITTSFLKGCFLIDESCKNEFLGV